MSMTTHTTGPKRTTAHPHAESASRRALLAALPALALPAAWTQPAAAQTFDHGHAAWSALLRRHVRLLDGGRASQLRYAGMAAERAALKAWLATLSAVPRPAFDGWARGQQMAFLINAYNGFTVELVLSRYPNLKSIKDLGSFLSSPWKPKWIPLLGETLSLDNIEHDMLRAPGRYSDPRIHFAVNCASIGCPMLREEAFVAERLDAQLDEQARRFMGDRSRNRFSPASRRLELSKIFDWYGGDFNQSQHGITSLAQFCASQAEQLADLPADRDAVRAQKLGIDFLDYDWALNDARGEGR